MRNLLLSLPRHAIDLVTGPIARGSIISLAIKLIGIALGFAQAVIAARVLGAHGYGLVAVALAVVQVGATIAVLGFNTLSVREIAGWLATGATHHLAPFTRRAVATVLLISILIGCFIVLTYAFAPGLLAQYADVLLFSALIIPGWAMIQLLRGIAQGFGDVSGAQWPGEILRPALVITLALGSLPLIPRLTAETFLLFYATAAFVGVLVASMIARRHLAAHWSNGADETLPPNWMAKAVPFLGLSVSAVLLGELATLILAIFATPEQAGLYQPVARLTPILALPATAATMRYAPRVAEFWRSDQIDRLASVTRIFSISTTGLTTLATLVLAGFGQWLLMIFGPEFTTVAPLLWIIGAAQVFDAACGPAGPILMMTGKSGVALRGYAYAVVVNALLGLALIPPHGATGAAIAVACGIVTANVFMLRDVCKKNGFNPSIFPSILRLVMRPATDERTV